MPGRTHLRRGIQGGMLAVLAWRFEANFAHAFDDGDVEGGSQIGLRAGLSFFTR